MATGRDMASTNRLTLSVALLGLLPIVLCFGPTLRQVVVISAFTLLYDPSEIGERSPWCQEMLQTHASNLINHDFLRFACQMLQLGRWLQESRR